MISADRRDRFCIFDKNGIFRFLDDFSSIWGAISAPEALKIGPGSPSEDDVIFCRFLDAFFSFFFEILVDLGLPGDPPKF